MTKEEVLTGLINFQKWRRANSVSEDEMKDIGKTIEGAILIIKEVVKAEKMVEKLKNKYLKCCEE
jgi:hypothetical protein